MLVIDPVRDRVGVCVTDAVIVEVGVKEGVKLMVGVIVIVSREVTVIVGLDVRVLVIDPVCDGVKD